MANITINNQTTADRTTAPTHEELYLQARSGNEQALWRLCTDYRALFISESQKYATAMADLMDTSDWISIGNILVWDIVSKGNFDPTVSSWGGYLMERNLDVGICGAKVMYASERNKIQDLGGKLNMDTYNWGGMFGGQSDLSGDVILECDYVASCALMARTKAVKVFGGFPEDNFIYFDDIEWCTKCRRAGYKVTVNGKAKAYHDMSGASPRNLFLAYYATRNRCRFFTKYLPEDRLEDFYNKITEEVFTRIYGAQRKEMTGTVDTLRHAFDDFVHGVTGKAADGRIKKFVEPQRKLEELVNQIETAVFTTKNGSAAEFAVMWQMIRYFMLLNPSLSLRMKVDIDDAVNTEGNSRVFVACPHVSEITKDVLPAIYIDGRKNCVLDESDYEYFVRFKTELEKFRDHYRPLFEERKKVERA